MDRFSGNSFESIPASDSDSEGVEVLKQARSLEILEKQGILSRQDGQWMIDEGRLSAMDLGDVFRRFPTKITADGISHAVLPSVSAAIDALLKLDSEGGVEGANQKPIILLPRDKKSAINGEFNNQGAVNIENFGRVIQWDREVKLNDGEVFNYAELYFARALWA